MYPHGGGVEVTGSGQVHNDPADISPVTEPTFVRYLACQHTEVRQKGGGFPVVS